MSDFDLESFLKGYKPKKKKMDLSPYTKCDKLKSYTMLTSKNMDDVEEAITYIKYIPVGDALKDKKYSDHIKCGGILLAGGIYDEGKFKAQKDRSMWTHLHLKFVPFPKINRRGVREYVYEDHAFYIKISNYHLFYKIFG